jgi:phosphoheptose isomerase
MKKLYFDYKNKFLHSLNILKYQNIFDSIYILKNTINNNNKIFICGNGGSSAIASHFQCDFFKTIRLYSKSKIKPKIISLVSDIPLITAITNDIGYADIFKFQIESLARKGDTLLCISSSGKSKNIIAAAIAAKKIGVNVISLIGFSGKLAKQLKINSSQVIEVKSNNYQIIEDIHSYILHFMTYILSEK